MPSTVTVVSSKKVDTGSYSYYELVFEQEGKEKTQRVFTGKNKELETIMKNLQGGETAEITWQKNEKGFYNVANLTVGGKATTKTSTAKTYTKTDTATSKSTHSYADNAIGQQVGNALTNAVNSLGGKAVTISQIETRAWELILLGERLKKRIASGDHEKDNAQPDRDVSLEYDSVEEEDIPF